MNGFHQMFAWLSRLVFGKRILRGRTSDPALCRIPGVDEPSTEQALKLICDAFLVPKSQRHCLRPDDTLISLYLDGAKRRWFGDDMEFAHLFLFMEDLGITPSEDEIEKVETVSDVIRLLAEHAKK